MSELTQPNEKDTIGGRFRRARLCSHLTQKQAAAILGIHRPSVSEIEADRRRLSADEAARFARAVDVDAHWLVTGEGRGAVDLDEKIRRLARVLCRMEPEDLDELLETLDSLRT